MLSNSTLTPTDLNPPRSRVINTWSKKNWNRLERCVYVSAEGKKCGCVSIKGTGYCRWHIPEDLKPKPQSIELPPSTIDEKNFSSENDDLSFEIKFLKMNLHRLINNSPKKITPEDLRIQIQLIEQIRKLVQSLSIIESQSKMYNLVSKIISSIITRVVEIVHKHITDDNVKRIIAEDLMRLSEDENENSDLKMLLKQINPKQGGRRK